MSEDRYAVVIPGAGGHLRNAFGGTPLVPAGEHLHECGVCGSLLQLFIQFDIPHHSELVALAGRRFILSMCPNCNEIPTFDFLGVDPLPPLFWDKLGKHFFAALFPVTKVLVPAASADLLIPRAIEFAEQPMPKSLRVSDVPEWIQGDESRRCGCGSRMQHFCQVPENFGFPKRNTAPEQVDSFSATEYCLFLGNELYISVCESLCSSRAVWIAVQN